MNHERQQQRDGRTSEHDQPLRASMDYTPAEPSGYTHPDRERTPKELANAATAWRREREEAFVASGLVAGHDFKREVRERERSR